MTKSRFGIGLRAPSAIVEPKRKRGKLKIFFGTMPGVGKTMAMLRAAQAEAANGRRVVAGIVTWQTSPEAMVLMGGLAVVPPRKTERSGVSYTEIDVEAVLAMCPDVVLVPESAHVNAPGSRNVKRHQDITEMLDNGIDVFTTLNFGQLASRAEYTLEMTGYEVSTVPDEFFSEADVVETVDMEPGKLEERFREGKIFIKGFSNKDLGEIYRKDKIEIVRKKFFQMALDRENWQKQHIFWPAKIRSRMLVPIWPDEITPYVIRRAKAMATAIDTDWIALYMETDSNMTDREKARLEDNIRFARQFGGIFMTYKGNDPVEALIEVSRIEKISHIILGKTFHGKITGQPGKSFLKRLLKYSGHINISLICGETGQYEKKRLFNVDRPVPGLGILMLTVLVAIVTGMLCTLLDNKTRTDAAPYIVILGLFMFAIFARASAGLILALLALLACTVFFLPPSFTFVFDISTDIPRLLLLCFAALLNGLLTMKIRANELETFRREKQSNALFLLTRRLSEATGIDDVVDASTESLLRYFDIPVFFIFRDAGYQLTDLSHVPKGLSLSEKELETAAWAFKHDKPAGRFTDVMPSNQYTCYPLIGKGKETGVLVAKLEKPFAGKEDISWNAFLAQIAQSLEHQHLTMTTLQANVLNESDKLYKTLFNSISHELRIPISSIMGASDTLLETQYPEEVQKELYGEIFGASKRLNRLVENLLNISRLESGRIAANPDWCDIRDLFNRVSGSLKEDLRPFRFEMTVPELMPLVKVDFGLMEQVLYNLLYNATRYAPQGTVIRLSACYENGFLIMVVTDRGPGFDSPESLSRIFKKFWRPQGEKPGGLGLGLSIVKGFVEAHNGTVFVNNRKGGGARFTVAILTEKADYNDVDEAEKSKPQVMDD